ncbi:OmpA family protein [Cystobacter fuscus]|uniref:OmpA family protein n=1 Tax=Cystobacter fuscus TaxID=43 RepID=UPI002B2C5499|nr:OmpA family protein [Cystobacter fuscus]
MSLPSSTTRAAMAVSLLACAQAWAQSSDDTLPGFELERLETNMGRGSVLMGNGELMVPGGLSVNLLNHYQRLPLILNDGKRDLALVQNRVTTVLSASYGVLPWLELGAQVPIVLWQKGDDARLVGLAPLTAQGLSAPVIQARLGLLSRQQRKPVDLAADLSVGLPFGSQKALSGDAGTRFQARMTLGTTVGWIQPSLEAGVLFRPAIPLATPEGAADYGISAEAHLGATVSTLGKSQRGELTLRATLGSQVSVDLLGGVRFPLLAGFDAFVMGGPGIGGALGTPLFRVLAGVAFRSEPPPKISFINEKDDQEFQLSMAQPSAVFEEKPVQPTSTWQLNALARQENPEQAQQGPRPYQPGPYDKILFRGELRFAQGSASIPPVVPLLDKAAQQFFDKVKAGVIYVEAHSDSEASDWSDMTVSVQRAQAVRRYLIYQGVPPEQVKIRPFGTDWPVSPKPATEEEHQLNRRVDVIVVNTLTASTTPP